MCPECPGIRATQPSPVEVREDPTSPKHTLEPTGFTHRNVLIYPQKWSYYNAQIHTSTICSTEKTESTREKVSLEAPVHQGKVGCPEMGTPTAQPPAPLAGRPGPKHTVSSRVAHGHTTAAPAPGDRSRKVPPTGQPAPENKQAAAELRSALVRLTRLQLLHKPVTLLEAEHKKGKRGSRAHTTWSGHVQVMLNSEGPVQNPNEPTGHPGEGCGGGGWKQEGRCQRVSP